MNGEPLGREQIHKILSAGLPHYVVAFRDGEEALQYLQGVGNQELRNAAEPVFDVVVLDMHLVKVNGPTILAAIRRNAKLGEIPVVVLSSAISLGGRQLISRYHVARQINKPADLDEFLCIGQTVREVLAEHQDRMLPKGL